MSVVTMSRPSEPPAPRCDAWDADSEWNEPVDPASSALAFRGRVEPRRFVGWRPFIFLGFGVLITKWAGTARSWAVPAQDGANVALSGSSAAQQHHGKPEP